MQRPVSADSSTLGASTWAALLEGADAEAAWESIRAVADGLWTWRESAAPTDPSLAGGLAGDAWLYAELANSSLPGPWAERAEACLESVIAQLSFVPLSPGFFAGFTGIAWSVERIQRLLPQPDPQDLNKDIDEILLDYVDQRPFDGGYDLISGLVGIGVYALERMDRPTGAELLKRVIQGLDDLSEQAPTGLTWTTPPHHLPAWQREFAPHGYYNLGLSHGIPGVIALLAHASQRGVAEADPLLRGAMAWLWAQEKSAGLSHFSAHIPLDVEFKPLESRLAWCYGDLGISVAVLDASRRARMASWEEGALRLALSAAARPLNESGVKDASVCHGSAGNAHLFNRLYQATGHHAIATAARAWFHETLTHAKPGHLIGGFQTWNIEDHRGFWKDEPGLLEGSCGVALALLSAVSPNAPVWDRFLLVG